MWTFEGKHPCLPDRGDWELGVRDWVTSWGLVTRGQGLGYFMGIGVSDWVNEGLPRVQQGVTKCVQLFAQGGGLFQDLGHWPMFETTEAARDLGLGLQLRKRSLRN